jgi:hypothetical protein
MINGNIYIPFKILLLNSAQRKKIIMIYPKVFCSKKCKGRKFNCKGNFSAAQKGQAGGKGWRGI